MSGRTRPSVCQPVIVLCSLFTLATADYADQHGFFISLFRYANVLRLGEESQCFLAAFAADAACLHAAERNSQVAHEPAVHPDCASMNFFGDAMCAIQVLRPNARSQAVIGVVGVA